MFIKEAEAYLNSIGIYDVRDYESEFNKVTKYVKLSFAIHLEEDLFGEEDALRRFIKEHSHGVMSMDELLWEIPHNEVLFCEFTSRGLTMETYKGKFELVFSFLQKGLEEKLFELYREARKK